MRRLVMTVLLMASAAALASPIAGQGTWETSLQARDINGDGTVDAYYDTDLNITWLADANYGAAAFPKVTGASAGTADRGTALAWAHGLDYFGVTGWRLPQVSFQNLPPESTDPGQQIRCFQISVGCTFSSGSATAPSELDHLWRATLGNTGALTNTGMFSNVGGLTWDESLYRTPTRAYIFVTALDVGDLYTSVDAGYYAQAWAVHDGDIASPVPEPETYAMMLVGLAVLALSRRRSVQA